ncbi:MAG: hypothetical protein ACLVJN_06435 [Streptococcus parasanguinis]
MKYLRRIMWSLALVATVLFRTPLFKPFKRQKSCLIRKQLFHPKDNQAVTSGTTVLTNEKLSATINVAFPDTQAIQAGDTP